MRFRALNFDYQSEASARIERRQLLGNDNSNVKQHPILIQEGLYERSIKSSRDIRIVKANLRAKEYALKSSISKGFRQGDSSPFFSNDEVLSGDPHEGDNPNIVTLDAPFSDEPQEGFVLGALAGQSPKLFRSKSAVSHFLEAITRHKLMPRIANLPWTEKLRHPLHSQSNQCPVSVLFVNPFVSQTSFLPLPQENIGTTASSGSRELHLRCARSELGRPLATLFLSNEVVLHILASIPQQKLMLHIADQPRHESLCQLLQSLSYRFQDSRNRTSFLFSSRYLIMKATIPRVSFSTANSNVFRSSNSTPVNVLEQASDSIPFYLPSNTTSKKTRNFKRKNHRSNEEKIIRKKERKAIKSGKHEEVKKRKHSHSMTEQDDGTPRGMKSSKQFNGSLQKPLHGEEILPIHNQFHRTSGDIKPLKAPAALTTWDHQNRVDLPHTKPQTSQKSSRFQAHIRSQKPQQEVFRVLTNGFTHQTHVENVRNNPHHRTCKDLDTAATRTHTMHENPLNITRVFMLSESPQNVALLSNISGKPAMAPTLPHVYPLTQTAKLLYQTVPVLAPLRRSNEQKEATSREFNRLQVSIGLSKYQGCADKPKNKHPRTTYIKSPEAKPASEPLQLLCSESFLETWGECVIELASGRWANVRSADNGEFDEKTVSKAQKICLVDTPLVQSCRVDIEASQRCGLLVLMSSNLASVAEAKKIVCDVAELVAIGRYVELFVFICCDSNIAPATTKHIVQLQCAVASSNGIPSTQVTFKFTTAKSLSMSLAHTILSRRKLLPNVKLLEDATIHAVTDRQIAERAQFLLSLLPSLCANGAVQCLLLSQHLLPNESSYFEQLFNSKTLRQNIAFTTTSKEKGADVHPASMARLALAAIIDIRESIESEREESP